jgi:hypothetical protein
MEETLKMLMQQVESLNSRITSMQRQIDLLYLKIENRPSSEVVFEKDNLRLTMEDARPLLTRYDLKVIKKVCSVIAEFYPLAYEYLPYAVNQWLKEDPNRPFGENTMLLNYNLPPIAEQSRLYPGRALKDFSYIISSKMKPGESISDIKSQDEKWRQEQKEIVQDIVLPEKIEITKSETGNSRNISEFREKKRKIMAENGFFQEIKQSVDLDKIITKK